VLDTEPGLFVRGSLHGDAQNHERIAEARLERINLDPLQTHAFQEGMR
jgi:hypothetical protein